MQVIFATRCFTTIVPRLTNSQNKVALMIMGMGIEGLCSQDARKESGQEKTARGAGVGRGGEG